ncbi:hypothetical protein [Rickettsia endosymbiont of Nabis limbatus]|uniref:hypothetical protein n=1 Tax=Rickettsia endosymbiont of Nabis limbatus TaxID=3066268 RepID=UPI003AF36997
MNNELFALSLKTFDTIWGDTKTCDNSDNTFEIVRLGNTMRNRIYRLMNKKLISRNCFSDNDCSLNEEAGCNIFDFVNKNSNSLNLKAYVEYVNNTIFRVVNSFDNTRIFGPEYKIFSPDNTPLLYEHQCITNESILIKNVHKMVLAGQDVSMQTPKTGKCGIFRIEYMSDKLKQMVQEVIPDVVNNTTSSILDFFSTTETTQTSLNHTTNYGMIDYNSTNSTDITSYDAQNTHDNTMLVNGLILASAVTFTASMTYLVTHMYNKYCKAPIAQPETNISDPTLMEINRKTVKIYHSDSSSEGKDYAIIDISSRKAKYTKSTYDSSNPSSSHSDDHERMELMSSTDDSIHDNININAYSLASSSANKTDYVQMSSKKETNTKSTNDTSHPSTSDSYIYETINNITDQGYITDSYTQDKVNLKTYSRVALNQEGNQHIRIQLNSQPYINKGNESPIYDNCGSEYDYPPLHPRPVTVIENKNFHVPIEQYHDDLTLLGLSEFPC